MTPVTALDRDDIDTDDTASSGDGPAERADEDILDEIRTRRTDAKEAWADIREEGTKDVMCVAGDVWAAMDDAGYKQRKDAGRPAIAPDEIGQYINQVGNDVRQNKRSIRATPIGNGATKNTADFIQGRIRQIEYRSNAQRDVYSPMFEDALQRSYGFGRIIAKRVSDTSRNLELMLEAFPNPDVVLVDPYGAMLAPDCSKIQFAFVLDASRSRKQFKREFPGAEIVDFTDEHARIAPDWIKGDNITLAEYWTIEQQRKRVVFLKIDPARGFYADTLPRQPKPSEVDYEHWVDVPSVCQYLTNGVELLAKKGQKKRTPWPGKSIPIVSCFGKVLYVQEGSGTQRRLLSMVRHMRQPVMYYSYVRSCEAEVVGGVPRATWVGYEGQFREHEQEWAKANHEPVPFLVAKPFTEATGPGQLLPLPQRQNWDPPLQNLDMLAESARRMIQSAAGVSPLPTEAQRQNQKSGKALDRIEASGQKGSYHFVDHLDGSITRFGQLLAELIPHYDDTAGEVTIRKPNDQPAQQSINDPNNTESVMLSTDHQHDITISVGPYEADEREASSDFADTIIGNAPLMQTVGPQKAAALTAAAIRLKAVGPIGDEMAEIIDPKPPEDGAPPSPQQMVALQQQVQQLQQQLQEATKPTAIEQVKQQGEAERAATDAKVQIILQHMENAAKIEVARISASKQSADPAAEAAEERLATGLEQAHEASQAAMDRAHEVGMATLKHAHASAQAAQSTDQAMAQAEHAQAIAPPTPEAETAGA